jgi:hypothetical protein
MRVVLRVIIYGASYLMWYRIDFVKLTQQLLPTFLRQTRIIALLRAMITPVIDIHDNFVTFRDSCVKKLGNATISVIALEKLLNDEFQYENNEIYITDFEGNRDIYLFNVSEVQSSNFAYNLSEAEDALYLFNTGEQSREFDFVINIPNEINNSTFLYQIATIANFYKMPGKGFKIESYE